MACSNQQNYSKILFKGAKATSRPSSLHYILTPSYAQLRARVGTLWARNLSDSRNWEQTIWLARALPGGFTWLVDFFLASPPKGARPPDHPTTRPCNFALRCDHGAVPIRCGRRKVADARISRNPNYWETLWQTGTPREKTFSPLPDATPRLGAALRPMDRRPRHLMPAAGGRTALEAAFILQAAFTTTRHRQGSCRPGPLPHGPPSPSGAAGLHRLGAHRKDGIGLQRAL